MSIKSELEYKCYKIKSYNNSDGDPFGVTINGKTKDYLEAHNKFRQIIKKGNSYDVEFKSAATPVNQRGKMSFLNVVITKTLFDAIVEITSQDGTRSNVQLKSYNPSQNKRKGATTELRKLPDFDYDQVDILKAIVTSFLDTFINGDTLETVLKGSNTNSGVKKISSEQTSLFSCDLCNYKTKYKPGLKMHKTKIHLKNPNKCTICDFVSFSNSELKEHLLIQHPQKEQTKKRSQIFDISGESQESLPSLSPVKKKASFDCDVEMPEVIDDDTKFNLTKKIEVDIVQLKNKILELEDLLKKELEVKKELNSQIEKLQKNKQSDNHKINQPVKIPSHLSGVHETHLSSLHGFKMRYCAIPDGACLTNCLTAHISCTEDKEERRINNRRVNHHIADNFDNYYINKISLPYIETIGVGKSKKMVKCDTKDEFLSFLRSEDSLCVYSNHQEIQAIANMLNITVKIYTYGIGGDEKRCEWREVGPDSELANNAHFPKGLVPDMYLYNSDQNHYDLLVSDNHHLALLGLITNKQPEKKLSPMNNLDSNSTLDTTWETVKNTNKRFSNRDESGKIDEKDLKVIDQEANLVQAKKNGFKRTNPSTPSEPITINQDVFQCHYCKIQLESEGLLQSHINEHKKQLKCSLCENEFDIHDDLKKHMIQNHTDKDWNCNDCFFQASNSDELRNHLKITGHQPSNTIQHNKSKITHCYTCKEEFLNYWSLMNHRRLKHPSNRMCRYFLKNQCVHGSNCWYLHEEPMEIEFPSNKFKTSTLEQLCQQCDKSFDVKSDLKDHIKKYHKEIIKSINESEIFNTEKVFNESEEVIHESVFQYNPKNPFPPDQSQTIMNTLNIVLQKMKTMESFFQQKL